MSEFRRWKIDHTVGAVVTKKSAPDPPGFKIKNASDLEQQPARGSKKERDPSYVQRKQAAFQRKALDPAKQAGFMCFMLWMSGNSLQIFSIMMMVSCIYSPIQSLMNVTRMFPPDKDVSVLLPRILFCLVQCGQLLFAMYKLNSMGLLPTYASDWISQMESPSISEVSFGAVIS